jgi:hypothetical protein
MKPLDRLRALALLLLLPFAAAWRPYDTADGSTTPQGLVAVEWGLVTFQIQEPRITLALPQLLARVGLGQNLELGVRGVYRLSFDRGRSPWDHGMSAGDVGAYGKWVLVSGSMQNTSWVRPSVALLAGVQFLTETSLWALDARAAGSLFIGPVLVHLNVGFHQSHRPGVLAGAVLCVPLSFGLTPAVEMSGEVRFGPEQSQASVLFALTQAIPGAPINVDLALRRGLTGGTPDWSATAGLTLQVRAFKPRRP